MLRSSPCRHRPPPRYLFPHRHRLRLPLRHSRREDVGSSRLLWLGVLLVVAGVTVFLVFSWWSHRLSHSITDDAFVEAHIVNIAPQAVSGHLVRFLVEENDRVEQGQVLAEIDAVPYRDQVELARSKVEGAEAELRRQEAALARLRLEVPIQIEIAAPHPRGGPGGRSRGQGSSEADRRTKST